jgi:Asp-tRNA(Asn)/Glu-tRNA(Gln) amidotransferase A subunit family amidase
MNADQALLLPAWRIAELVRAGDLSPIAIVTASLRRIARFDPYIHAFLTVTADQALAEAATAADAVRAGKPLGPLHGVPIAVKDELWTRGVRTTAGSPAFEDFVPAEDGAAMARLRAAGAILIGKTNVPEFMCWSRTANNLGPETVNPWDLQRSPGASSGGSGAALAAGIVPLAIGSDGGGSIRIPSALCGVHGLFPTPGRVPDTGSFSYSPVGSLGPMARDVRDLALALTVMAGPDGEDDRKAPPLGDVMTALDRGVEGMRCAWTPDFGHIRTQPGLPEAIRGAIAPLEQSGAAILPIEASFEDFWEILLASADVLGEVDGITKQPFTRSAEFLERCLRPGNFERLTPFGQGAVTAKSAEREARERTAARLLDLRARVEALFERYDVLLSPTMPTTAPVLPEGLADPYPYPPLCCGTYFTSIANLCRLPAASMACGLFEGLPMAVQVIAPFGREDTVLRVCAALERAMAPPPLIAPMAVL